MPTITEKYIDNQISKFDYSQSLQKKNFDGTFYEHLYALKKFEFISGSVKEENRNQFGLNDYLGLEQFVMEKSILIEQEQPNEIDWELLSDARERFKEKLRSKLGNEKNSETLKPLILFTTDSFENSLMYSMMHPNAKNNSWVYTDEIIKKGILFMATDDKDMIKDYYPKALENNIENNNIGVLATVKDEKKFSGFFIDDRLRTQSKVYLYLREVANGHYNAKSKDSIRLDLKERGINITTTYLNYNILLPLKRAAIVGATSRGFYFINSEEDLQMSYDFHHKKYDAIGQTMALIEARAKYLGYNLK